jgi:DNA-binding transcriptional LysR family regulator
MIAKVAEKIRRGHPGISYHLFSGNAEDVTERIDSGLLDFGILIEPAGIKKYDFIRLPTKDRWGLLMWRDHPLAEKSGVHQRICRGFLSLPPANLLYTMNYLAGLENNTIPFKSLQHITFFIMPPSFSCCLLDGNFRLIQESAYCPP